VRALDSEDIVVRYRAAYALGKIGHRRALPALLRATEDPSPDVAYDATIAIGHLRTLDAIPDLINLFRYEGAELSSAAGTALIGLGPVSIRAIMDVVGELSDEAVGNAIFVISNIGGADARSALEALSQSANRVLATIAARALVGLDDQNMQGGRRPR